MNADELKRRRTLLSHYIGEQVTIKRGVLKPSSSLYGLPATLLDVRRTRVELDFGSPETWDFPIASILLPGSTEPAPGQKDLF